MFQTKYEKKKGSLRSLTKNLKGKKKISYLTLWREEKGYNMKDIGRPKALHPHEEKKIVGLLKKMSNWHQALDQEALFDLVEHLLDERIPLDQAAWDKRAAKAAAEGKTPQQARLGKRPDKPFGFNRKVKPGEEKRTNRPGAFWLRLFFKRHSKHLSHRVPRPKKIKENQFTMEQCHR